jgi:hypothetical protein
MVLCHASQIKGILFYFNDTGQHKTFFHFLLKFRVILIALTFLNLNMTTKLPYHPPSVKEEGLNLKKKVCNKKSNTLVSNYNIHYHNKQCLHILYPN